MESKTEITLNISKNSTQTCKTINSNETEVNFSSPSEFTNTKNLLPEPSTQQEIFSLTAENVKNSSNLQLDKESLPLTSGTQVPVVDSPNLEQKNLQLDKQLTVCEDTLLELADSNQNLTHWNLDSKESQRVERTSLLNSGGHKNLKIVNSQLSNLIPDQSQNNSYSSLPDSDIQENDENYSSFYTPRNSSQQNHQEIANCIQQVTDPKRKISQAEADISCCFSEEKISKRLETEHYTQLNLSKQEQRLDSKQNYHHKNSNLQVQVQSNNEFDIFKLSEKNSQPKNQKIQINQIIHNKNKEQNLENLETNLDQNITNQQDKRTEILENSANFNKPQEAALLNLHSDLSNSPSLNSLTSFPSLSASRTSLNSSVLLEKLEHQNTQPTESLRSSTSSPASISDESRSSPNSPTASKTSTTLQNPTQIISKQQPTQTYQPESTILDPTGRISKTNKNFKISIISPTPFYTLNKRQSLVDSLRNRPNNIRKEEDSENIFKKSRNLSGNSSGFEESPCPKPRLSICQLNKNLSVTTSITSNNTRPLDGVLKILRRSYA